MPHRVRRRGVAAKPRRGTVAMRKRVARQWRGTPRSTLPTTARSPRALIASGRSAAPRPSRLRRQQGRMRHVQRRPSEDEHRADEKPNDKRPDTVQFQHITSSCLCCHRTTRTAPLHRASPRHTRVNTAARAQPSVGAMTRKKTTTCSKISMLSSSCVVGSTYPVISRFTPPRHALGATTTTMNTTYMIMKPIIDASDSPVGIPPLYPGARRFAWAPFAGADAAR